MSPDMWHLRSLPEDLGRGPADAAPLSGHCMMVQVPPAPQGVVVMQIYEPILILDCIPLSIRQIRFVLDTVSHQGCSDKRSLMENSN